MLLIHRNIIRSVFFAATVLAHPIRGASWPHRRERLVWQEDFSSKAGTRPNAAIWAFDEGSGAWGNGELEFYCAYGSASPPCDPAKPNAFLDREGNLHIVARKLPDGRFTSARLLTKGLKTFQYGRFEARIRVPSGHGMWPAFWLLGEDTDGVKWPDCGELDVMENLGKDPNTVYGSIHGKGFTGIAISTAAQLPDKSAIAAGFHTFGMIWRPGSISFYVDDPRKPYAFYTPKNLPHGAVWPFDNRQFYLLLNLAVGGSWPGNPDSSTIFPAEILVDYVRVWELK